jgi:hypothetical protein
MLHASQTNIYQIIIHILLCWTEAPFCDRFFQFLRIGVSMNFFQERGGAIFNWYLWFQAQVVSVEHILRC